MHFNFFSKIYLAITDFRFYPYVVQKEKFINAFAYFITFILMVSMILAVGVSVRVISWISEFSESYDSVISDFFIANGELEVYENMDLEFNGVKIYSDDTKNFSEFDLKSFDSDDCKVSVLAFKDALAIGNESVGFVWSNYSDLKINIDKADTYQILELFTKNPGVKLGLTFSILCGVFVSYLITKFINVLGISIMLVFLGLIFKTKYKFKNYMEIAFYVVTLPIFVEVIALMVVGFVNEYAYLTYYLLVYVYMYYAIRALKLDNIITATQEKIFGARIIKNDENKDDENKEDMSKDSTDNDDVSKENNSERQDTKNDDEKKE